MFLFRPADGPVDESSHEKEIEGGSRRVCGQGLVSFEFGRGQLFMYVPLAFFPDGT